MNKVYEGNLVEIFEVAPHVYFRHANLPVRGQCNGAFIETDSGVALVDTPPHAAEMILEARTLFRKPIETIFLTHGHGDHCEGLDAFLDLDVTVYCHRRLFDRLRPVARRCRAAFVGVEGTMPLSLPGGIAVELFTFANVLHSPWDMFVRLVDSDILCTGDSVVEFETAYFHSADISNWIAGLRRLFYMGGRYILSGHADALLPHEYINDFADLLCAVERCARLCFTLYRADPRMTDRERFSDISPDKVSALVADYFAQRDEDVRYIEARAKDDAQREVRMVLWEFIRPILR